ncbi:fenitrothion hydrolase [Conexibacter sp. W3-3-2]|uniref:fenitrothion hydrolase n=1 Tax=Conexibacter sp. W3-3-2 TaxID=2675227 RepID=UPI0012B6B468|nr:fenitrothion hydrolase [Conexibacter sp. W3-3-2]MTD47484.1 fenitrothion hydrolase [Conexibacter sp. W3-3-2]
MTVRRVGAAVTLVLGLALVLPGTASAHGLVGRLDLPVPQWLFAWTAAVVLVVSFIGLSIGWSEPRLERERPAGTKGVTLPTWPAATVGVLGIAVFVLVVVAGLFGEQDPGRNIAPTLVYVAFWVAVPLLSLLLGDVFRVINPWRTTAKALGFPESRPDRPYPVRAGRLPAAATIVLFAWVELVAPFGDEPRVIAVLAIGYFAAQLWGMRRYGIATWSNQADGFAVAFSLIAAMAPLRWEGRRVTTQPLLAGLAAVATPRGTLAVLCVMIGTTSFDGASQGGLWTSFAPDLGSSIGDLGLGAETGRASVDTLGIALCIALIIGLYRVAISGMASIRPGIDRAKLAERFAHSLVPIALAYLLAHYFSLLVFQGQALGFMVSDPLTNGSDYFGTATAGIDLNAVSTSVVWYVQVGALLLGHVAGLVLAHDRSLVIFRSHKDAVRSQYWMLAVMVGYTCLGLWLLSAVGT